MSIFIPTIVSDNVNIEIYLAKDSSQSWRSFRSLIGADRICAAGMETGRGSMKQEVGSDYWEREQVRLIKWVEELQKPEAGFDWMAILAWDKQEQ